MDFQQILDWGLSFYRQQPIFCYVALGILLLFSLWKPLKALKTACLLLVLVTLIYVSFYFLETMNFGIDAKSKAIQQTEKSLEK